MRTIASDDDAMAVMARPTCLVCQSQGRYLYQGLRDGLFGAPGLWNVKQCLADTCGLLWLDPAPSPTDLWKAYKSYHTHADRPAGRDWPVKLARRLCSLLTLPLNLANGLALQRRRLRRMFLDELPPGRLLEIGFGGGRFLHRMKRGGWQVEGVDFDPEATRRARERYGLDVHTGELAAMKYEGDRFDAIVMSHSIEHLVAPRAALEECLRILKPGGTISITTPNSASLAHRLHGRNWRGLEPPRHLQIFSSASLRVLVEKSGLELARDASLSCDSAGVHYVSEALSIQSAGRPPAALRVLLRSFLRQQQEHRECCRGLSSGQDLLILGRKPAALVAEPSVPGDKLLPGQVRDAVAIAGPFPVFFQT